MSGAKDDPMWPFTAGFGTVEETTAPISIPLKTPLPDYLQGTLYRQGPGTYNINDITIPHWVFLLLRWSYRTITDFVGDSSTD